MPELRGQRPVGSNSFADLCRVCELSAPATAAGMAKQAKHRNPKLSRCSGESTCSQRPDGDHLRKIALELRDIASRCQFRGARLELRDLAMRFERRADHFDNPTVRRSSTGVEQAQPVRDLGADLVIQVTVIVCRRAYLALLLSPTSTHSEKARTQKRAPNGRFMAAEAE